MKKHLLSFGLLGIIALQGFSQSTTKLPVTDRLPVTDSKEYELMKQAGQLPGGLPVINNPQPFTPTLENLKSMGVVHKLTAGSSCGCYVAPDASYTLALARVDDGSSGLITIPFSFCMYGTNYTQLYVNNNGNISFGAPYGIYSSVAFPSSSYVMVAPFWADVDTRPAAGGFVQYKITPTAMYVNWTAVGYYPDMTDKLNTFQLIITNGTDPILPAGDNIAFCYGDMQWTTGGASGGVGGFGGTATGASPATVGINKGDGVNYIQMGRFAYPGAAYDGGYGLDDGVDWLDGQSLYFNVCSSTNIAPIPSITPPLIGGGSGGCDTLKLCGTNDTLVISALFLAPEIGQNTTIGINLYGTPGFSVLSNVPGNTASSSVQIIASPANAGFHTITFTATDDGTPVGTTVVNINVFIDTTGLAAFNPSISGVLDFCQGGSTTLSVAPTTFDAYIWNTGSTTTSTTVDSTGDYWVTSRKNGCFKTNLVHVTEHPKPTPVITGYSYACGGGVTSLKVDSLIYASYLWSTSATTDSISVGVGIYTVTVTDAFGCVGTSPPDTVTAPVPPVITGVLALCNGTIATLTTTMPYVSYLWTSGSTNDTAFVPAGTYSVSVVDINGCNITSAPLTVSTFPFTFGASGVVPYCLGHSITLTANPVPAATASLVWSTTATTPTISVNAGGSYTVTVTYPNGCTKDTTLLVPAPNPLPTPAIVGNLISCKSTPSTIGIDSSIYSSYLWSPGASTGTSVPVLSGTYTVTVTDSHGCTNTATATVVNFNPSVTIPPPTPFCPGDSITLTAIPTPAAGASYLWSNLNNTSSTVVSSTGNISVTVSYANGCTAADTVPVSQYTVPHANFSDSPPGPTMPLTPIHFTDLSTVTPGTIVSWAWYFGDSLGVVGSFAENPTHTYGTDGTYTVLLVVTSSNGCMDTVRYEYTVISPLMAPNIFTPNNDGKNDMFEFKNLDHYPDAELTVYNRWGNKVYESTNYQNSWGGGGQVDGVYYYILTAPKLDKPLTGFVQILR